MSGFNEMKEINEKNEISGVRKIIIAGCIIAILLSGSGLAVKFALKASKASEKNNTFSLVNLYYSKGEYDRALDKLELILMKNPEDKEALELMEKIIAAKEKSADGNTASGNVNSNVNVTLDTDGLEMAMKSSIDSMKSELEKNNRELNRQLEESNRELNRQIEKNNAEAEKNRKVMADLMKKQQEQAAVEKARQEKIIAQQKAAEEERKRKEEVQKKEAAEKKAAEELLMKKNAALKKEISGVNDEIQRGKTALNSGSIASAIESFKKAVELLPVGDGDSSVEPAFSASKNSEIAELFYEASQKASSPEDKKQLEELAVEYAKNAIQLDPKASSSQYILGMDAYAKKDFRSALQYLTKAVENNNGNSHYYYNLGRVQFQMKKFTEAKYSFATSCQLDSRYAPARYNLGITNKRLNDTKAALSDFRKAHEIDNQHENAYLEEARILVKMNDSTGAISAYKNVVRINNTNRNALNELGTVYSSEKKYEEAEEAFLQSLALLQSGTEDPLTYYNLSTVLFNEDKMTDALSYAKKAYESSGSLTDNRFRANIIYNYALLCEKTGNVDDAILKYGEVLKISPKHLKTQINLGAMYMNMNPPEADAALSLFLNAYEIDKNNFEVNNNLGSAYLAKEDYKNAILYFQNALKLDSKNNDVRYNLAQAFASDRQYDNSITTYKELLKTSPENYDGYIELAKVYMAKGDNETAAKYLEFVQIKKPDFKASVIKSLLQTIK